MQYKEETYTMLPPVLRRPCKEADEQGLKLQEIKLRVKQPVSFYTDQGERFWNERNEELTESAKEARVMKGEEIKEILMYLCGYSLFAYEDDIKHGFFTLEGGHRVGVSGQVVAEKDGSIRTVKYITFLTIRLAHEIQGTASVVIPHLYDTSGRVFHTLIVSPPGCGKTTMLRDITRQISDGNEIEKGKKVAVVDERSEIAGCYLGTPQNHVGMRTDVLYGCEKAEGIMLLIRSMSPEVVIVDEIGKREDLTAVETASLSGVSVVATMHARTVEEAKRKMAEANSGMRFERFLELTKDTNGFRIAKMSDEYGNRYL